MMAMGKGKMKGKPSISLVLGGPKSKGEPGDTGDDEPDMGDPDETSEDMMVDADEMMAFKAFDRATTPEAKARALKAFIKICGGY